jgi:hypothetical protein
MEFIEISDYLQIQNKDDRLAHISAACGQKNPLGIDSKLHKAATLAMSGSILKDPLGSSISMVKPLGAWIRIVG